MFGLQLQFDLSPIAGELERLTAGLQHRPERMLKYMTANVATVITDYFRQEIGTVHETAHRLGAYATHFYARKANQVSWRVRGNEGEITFPASGASRAYYDYKLVPTGGRQLLTIPVHKDAYGRRARSIRGLKWRRFQREDQQAGRTTMAGLVLGRPPRRKGGMFIAYYRGARQVHIPKNPRLMPKHETMEAAAEIGVEDYLNALYGAWL